MKKLLQNKVLIIVFILVLVGLVLALLVRLGTNTQLEPQGDKITVSQNGVEVTVYENGAVIRRNSDGTETREIWSLEKTAAFFKYYQETYTGTGISDSIATSSRSETGDFVEIGADKYPIADDDELSDIITDPNGDGSTGGSGDVDPGGGDDLGDFFDDGGDSDDGASDGGSTGGGEGEDQPEGEEECLFWRLSYCVIFPTPTPAPSPTPTPSPDFEALPPTCEEILNQETGRTVISNELCVTEPTPTPNL